MPTRRRVPYLDTIKAATIFLVFYGHFMEKLYEAGYDHVFLQIKLINSFHMPLFFFLSGVFWKPGQEAFFRTLKSKARTRLIPALFWGLVMIPYFLVVTTPEKILAEAASFLKGQPGLNLLMWFLIALFVVEIILAGLSRVLSFKRAPARMIGYASTAFLLGYLIVTQKHDIIRLIGLGPDFWYFGMVFSPVGFYILGYALQPWLLSGTKWQVDLPLAVFSGALLLGTFNLNQGNGKTVFTVVKIGIFQHGHYGWYLISALAGTLFMVAIFRLARPLTDPLKWLNFVGQYSIIFFALNSINLYITDGPVAELGLIPTGMVPLILTSILYNLLVLALYWPLAWLLKQTIPRLVGVTPEKRADEKVV